MKKDYTKIRFLSLFVTITFVFSLVLSGCAIRRVEKPNDGSDDIINVGPGGELPPDVQIVVGEDGQSYLVDGEGNSVIYNPTSAYIDPNATTAPTAAPTNPQTPGTTAPTSAQNTPSSSSSTTSVYNALAIQRKFGFNKLYDNFAGLANFYLDTIRVYFTYDGKDWLIELWKGEYAMASVGCEIGFYYNDNPSSSTNGVLDWRVAERKHFKAVDDSDAMNCSMELWQYVRSSDPEPVKQIDFGMRKCWWAASFENGVLEKHSDRTTLVMRGKIQFPNTVMMELFVEGLEARGFVEGNTSTYKNTERYEVNGTTVTVNWRYYDEDRFQDAQ